MILSKFNNWIYDPQMFIKFDDSILDDDILFCYGNGFNTIDVLKEVQKIDIKNKVYFNMEEPNSFFVDDWNRNTFGVINETFDFILTPFKYPNCFKKRLYTHIPIDKNIIYDSVKKYDVIYTGNYYNMPVISDIFKIMDITNSKRSEPNNTYYQKMKWISESKISIVHNLLYYEKKHYDSYIKSELFKHYNIKFGDNYPQLKSRIFESGISKSLILCYKDDYNLIEDFYEPGVDFIYYENYNDCLEKIEYISNNYSEFNNMIESAYNKTINNYTTYNTILKINKLFK